MRYSIALIIFFFISLNLSSQSSDFEEYNNLHFRNKSVLSNLEYKDIEGHPFSNKDLLPGKIVFLSGQLADSIPLRYNWYTKKMEFKAENELLEMPNLKSIAYVLIGKEKYIPFHYLHSIDGYLIELHQGKCHLFRQNIVQFNDATPAKSGYEKAQPASFKWGKPTYFMILNDGKIIKLVQNKKRLPQQFPGYEERITNFINKNKLKLKKEDELIQLTKQIEVWME